MKNEILGYLKIEFQRQTYTSCFVGYFRSLLYITRAKQKSRDFGYEKRIFEKLKILDCK